MSLYRSTSAILCVAEKELEHERQQELSQASQQETAQGIAKAQSNPQAPQQQHQQQHRQQQQHQQLHPAPHADGYAKQPSPGAVFYHEHPLGVAAHVYMDTKRWAHEQAVSETTGGDEEDDDESGGGSSGCEDGNGSQSAAHTGKNSSAGSNGETEWLPFTLQSGKEVGLSVAQLDRPLKDFMRYFRAHFREATKQDDDQVRVFRRRYQLRKSSKKGRDEQRQRQQQLERQVQEAARTRLGVDQVMDVIQPIIKHYLPDARTGEVLLSELLKVLGDSNGQPTH
jgi:hypothetical protein